MTAALWGSRSAQTSSGTRRCAIAEFEFGDVEDLNSRTRTLFRSPGRGCSRVHAVERRARLRRQAGVVDHQAGAGTRPDSPAREVRTCGRTPGTTELVWPTEARWRARMPSCDGWSQFNRAMSIPRPGHYRRTSARGAVGCWVLTRSTLAHRLQGLPGAGGGLPVDQQRHPDTPSISQSGHDDVRTCAIPMSMTEVASMVVDVRTRSTPSHVGAAPRWRHRSPQIPSSNRLSLA